ncbi:hypothetical protein [Rhizobium mesoamericanum]|uniref:hypothetical protein n=1 Tax=Rhizobium mesoamericanum TaxID=1079800 RepID=UPI0003F73E21|nr:hypothetical protein [Rhizobium mesoamericanum]
MKKQSGFHFYLNWARTRIDEMDAALASLEDKAEEQTINAREKADRILVNLRMIRDDFWGVVDKQAAASEATWNNVKAQLESGWTAFQVEVNDNIESFSQQVEQQQAIFRRQADAQLKAWRDAADQLDMAVESLTAERKAEVEAVAKRMAADADQAEEKLRKLDQAGRQSWFALTAALSETRAAFDRANQAARDAFRKAAG